MTLIIIEKKAEEKGLWSYEYLIKDLKNNVIIKDYIEDFIKISKKKLDKMDYFYIAIYNGKIDKLWNKCCMDGIIDSLNVIKNQKIYKKIDIIKIYYDKLILNIQNKTDLKNEDEIIYVNSDIPGDSCIFKKIIIMINKNIFHIIEILNIFQSYYLKYKSRLFYEKNILIWIHCLKDIINNNTNKYIFYLKKHIIDKKE